MMLSRSTAPARHRLSERQIAENRYKTSFLEPQAKHRLAWPAKTYRLSFDPLAYKEARIALALNGGFVRVENGKAIVRIKITYPKQSYAPLIHINGIGTIGVEEGLYWVLQKEGWLYEGYVEWIEKIETKI